MKGENIPALRFPGFRGEWEKKKLGDIALFSKGKGISKNDISENGSLECIRYGELYTQYREIILNPVSKTNLSPDNLVLSEYNDIIIPSSGETQIDIATASCVLKNGVALGGDLNIIKTENNGVFLSFYLNNKKKLDIANLAQGISVVHLYSSQLASLEVNLPTLPEQQKIASFFTAIDRKITLLKQQKSLLEQYKKGIMQKIFSQELRFLDDDGKEFPEWEEKKLGEIVEIKKGEQFNKTELSEIGIYPCINGGILPSGYTHQFNTQENTITISEGGNSCGFVNFIKTKFWSGGHCYTLNTKDHNTLDISYIFQILKFNESKLMDLRVGSGLPNIQKKDLINFSQNISMSFPEQTKIANFLSALDEKIRLVHGKIEKMELWKKGLLQKMFC